MNPLLFTPSCVSLGIPRYRPIQITYKILYYKNYFLYQTVDKVPRETELSGDFVIFEGI